MKVACNFRENKRKQRNTQKHTKTHTHTQKSQWSFNTILITDLTCFFSSSHPQFVEGHSGTIITPNTDWHYHLVMTLYIIHFNQTNLLHLPPYVIVPPVQSFTVRLFLNITSCVEWKVMFFFLSYIFFYDFFSFPFLSFPLTTLRWLASWTSLVKFLSQYHLKYITSRIVFEPRKWWWWWYWWWWWWWCWWWCWCWEFSFPQWNF